LIGVPDLTRRGALRFCQSDTRRRFLGDKPLVATAAPTLPELELVAWQLTRHGVEDRDALRW
jgi:hypothetical protein